MSTPSMEELSDRIADILNEDTHEGLFALLDEVEDANARFFVMEALMEVEEYRPLLNLLGPLTDPEAPGDNAHPWVLRGFAHYYLDELEDAQEIFTIAQKIDSKDIRALMGRALVNHEIDFQRAALLDIDKALMLMSDVGPDHPDSELRSLKAEVHNVQATFALFAEDNLEAEEALRNAAALVDDDGAYALDLGRLLSLSGRMEPALEALKQAIECDDLLLEARLLKSHVEGSLGKLEEALQTATETVAIDEEEPYSLLQLSSVLILSSRLEEAIEVADKAIELDPDIPDGYQFKMAALHGLGRVEEVSPEIEPFFQELADLPGFLYSERFDPYEEAAETLAELTDLDPMELMQLTEQFFATGKLPPALEPLMEQIMKDLPGMMQSMPGLFQALPPELAGKLMPSDPPETGRPNLTVIPGGKGEE